VKPYFEKMDPLGKELSPKQIKEMKDNLQLIEEVMKRVESEAQRIQNYGRTG